MEISRRQKDFVRTDSPAGDVDSNNIACCCVHKLTAPFTRAISRTDAFKDKKLIESCCIVLQVKVSQKKELQAEKSWPHVFPPTVLKMQDED